MTWMFLKPEKWTTNSLLTELSNSCVFLPWLFTLYTEKCSAICTSLVLRLWIIKVLCICLSVWKDRHKVHCCMIFDLMATCLETSKACFGSMLQTGWMLWSDRAVPSSSEGCGSLWSSENHWNLETPIKVISTLGFRLKLEREICLRIFKTHIFF